VADFGKTEKDILVFIVKNLPDTDVSRYLIDNDKLVGSFELFFLSSSKKQGRQRK